MVLRLRAYVEHVRHRRRVPGMPSPMDFNPVPQVWRMVAAFGLVRAMTKSRTCSVSPTNQSRELVTSVQSRNRNLAILFMTVAYEGEFAVYFDADASESPGRHQARQNSEDEDMESDYQQGETRRP